MRHLKLYEDLFGKDYSDSQIMKAVKIIKDHAESIGNDPEGKEAYIFRVDGNMVFFKSLAKGVSIEVLEAELPEMEKWGKEIVEQIESESSILDIDYRTFIDRRENFLGIGIRFFFPFDISDDIAVVVEESLGYPNIEYRDISNEELDGFTPEELNRILVCNNDGQGDTHCYTFSDMVSIISESDLKRNGEWVKGAEVVGTMKPSEIFDEFCGGFLANLTEYVYFDINENKYKKIQWK